MKRKLTALLLALACLFGLAGLAACDKEDGAQTNGQSVDDSQNESLALETGGEEDDSPNIVYTITDEIKQEIIDNSSNISNYALTIERRYSDGSDDDNMTILVNGNYMQYIDNTKEVYLVHNPNGEDWQYAQTEDGFIREELDDYYSMTQSYLYPFTECIDNLMTATFDEINKKYVANISTALDIVMGCQRICEYYFENNVLVKFQYGYIGYTEGDSEWYKYNFKEVPEVVLPQIHEHTVAEGWKKNDTYHWKESTCLEHAVRKLNKEMHRFQDNTCIVCQYEVQDAEGLTYQLSWDETYYIVTGVGNFTGDTLLIPSEYNSLPVKAIGAYAFQDAEFVTAIIPDTVEIIGTHAFYQCDSLNKVVIGNGIKQIENRAFYSWLNITEVYIYAETPPVLDGQTWQFDGDCTLYVPADYYEAYASLSGQREWGEFTQKTIVPEDQNIIDGVCYNKDATGIVFVDKNKEGDFVIPDSVTKIYPNAFENAIYITSVTVPSSVVYMGSNAFNGLKDTAKIYYNGTVNQWVQITFEDEKSNPFNRTQFVYINGDLVETITLSNIEKISNYAFYNCTTLTKLNITDTLEEIGDYAFYGCKNLSSIYFGDDLVVIGYSAFAYCDRIETLTYPTSLQKIDSYAFGYCDNLQTVHITSNVNEICEDAFRTENLSSITVDSANMTYASIDGLLYNKDVTQLIFVPMAKSGNILIPNTVTQIDATAFINCWNISGITVQSGNEKYHSAGNCIIDTENKALVALCKNSVIPNDSSVNKIMAGAFFQSGNLGNITIPSSITLIGEQAFFQSDFGNLTFEDNCNIEIGGDAFWQCDFNDVVFGNNIVATLKDSFGQCDLDNLVFGSNSEIVLQSNAFWQTDGKTITFGENGTYTLGEYCFGQTDYNQVVFGENSHFTLHYYSLGQTDLGKIVFSEGSEYTFIEERGAFWQSDFYSIIIDSENLISQLTSEYSCGELLTCFTSYSYGNVDIESGIYVKSTIDVSNCYLETSGRYTRTIATLDGIEYFVYR